MHPSRPLMIITVTPMGFTPVTLIILRILNLLNKQPILPLRRNRLSILKFNPNLLQLLLLNNQYPMRVQRELISQISRLPMWAPKKSRHHNNKNKISWVIPHPLLLPRKLLQFKRLTKCSQGYPLIATIWRRVNRVSLFRSHPNYNKRICLSNNRVSFPQSVHHLR